MVDWIRLDTLLRTHFEPLQYMLFFGALALLGGIESFVAYVPDGIDRRRRWPANWALTVINIMVLGAMPVSIVAFADHAAARGWGIFNHAFVPPPVAIATGFVLRSLVSYGIHVAMHKVPLMWRVHRVHHSDTQMDVSTTVRFHPVEFFIATPILLGITAMLGIPALALMVYDLFDAAMAVFTHANIRLPRRLDRILRLLVVTPAMHPIHHSQLQAQTDSNYSATFSLWDRLFGTYQTPSDDPVAMRLGLDASWDRHAGTLRWLLWLPFVAVHGLDQERSDPAPRAGVDRWIA